MPFHFDIKPQLDLLQVSATGKVTGEQLLACMEAFTADPAFYAGIDTLFDVPVSVQIDLGIDAIMDEVRRQVMETRGQTTYRTACVVGSQQHETFFITAMGILNPEAEARAFFHLREALAWLGHAEAGIRLRRADEQVLQQAR